MNKTKIEWVKNPDFTGIPARDAKGRFQSQGYTWNPITGCLNGCSYCYARKLANGRLKSRYLANLNVAGDNNDLDLMRVASKDPFYPRWWDERIYEPLRGDRKGKGIFTCDMGELFDDWVPKEWQREVFNIIRLTPENRYYLLTKQPQNLIKFSPFPDNCWVGVSATNYMMANKARYWLSEIEATVKYLSIEPFLEPLRDKCGYLFQLDYRLHWLIIGAQTKPTVFPKIEWVREIVGAADRAGTPVFLKDNLEPLLVQTRGDQKYAPLWANGGYGTLRQEVPK